MADESRYSFWVGLVFIFNLLFGTGVLAMPKIFSQAGYLVGILCLVLLSFVSFIQTTFLIESMANANFVKRVTGSTSSQCYDEQSNSSSSERSALLGSCHRGDVDDEQEYNSEPPAAASDSPRMTRNTHASILGTSPIGESTQSTSQVTLRSSRESVSSADHPTIRHDRNDQRFEIDEKFELGNMTELFLHRYLSKFFFFSIIAYLFGDLVIYNAMMAKSTRELICTSAAFCQASPDDHESVAYLDAVCWDHSPITHRWAYRICLVVFVSILLPLAYFKLQKTKVIQVLTIGLRWVAFSAMIGITIKMIAEHRDGHQGGKPPKPYDILHVPQLFGLCVYAFMLHHSVPSMVTPIRNKTKLISGVFYDYILVLVFMIIIGVSAVFAFDSLQCRNHTNPASVPGLNLFLPTFPIFTTFSSYPIIAGTLINNMKVLVGMPHNKWVNFFAPLVAIVPSAVIAFFTEDVSQIVSYVGSYTGTLIQYVFPCLLVYYSRRYVQRHCLLLHPRHQQKLYFKMNRYASPFQSQLWIYFTGLWYAAVVVLVTMQHVWVPPEH